VLIQGAGTAHLALAAGVLDELALHVIPVLFGQGRRLFEGLAAEQNELQRTRIVEGTPCSPHALTGPALNAAFPAFAFQPTGGISARARHAESRPPRRRYR
jgi:dihydrofolate reductase